MKTKYDQEGYAIPPRYKRRFWRLLSWLARHWFLALASTVRKCRILVGERAAKADQLSAELQQLRYQADESERLYKSKSQRATELQDKATERLNIDHDCSSALSILLRNCNWCIGSARVRGYPYQSLSPRPYLAFMPELNDTRRQDGRATPETIAKVVQSYKELPDGWQWKEDTKELVKPSTPSSGFTTDFRLILAAIRRISTQLQDRLDRAIEAEQIRNVLEESDVPQPA